MNHTPLQNRVDPWGALHATSARGSLMGNRGILHDHNQRIVRPWAHKAWIACVLSYGSVRRSVFAPGNYSELFFLDEATALAAGHRPCGQCQRERYLVFKEYWSKVYAHGSQRLGVAEIDAQLHAERTKPGGGKKTYTAALGELPVGTFFAHQGNAYLLWKEGIRLWSFEGYNATNALEPAEMVSILTPLTIVALYRLGFEPSVHESVGM